MPTLSVVVPALNEAARIGACLEALQAGRTAAVRELIVVDGGSSDATAAIAKAAGATVLDAPVASRAVQMNLGARHTTGDVLYFVHADARVPASYARDVPAAVAGGAGLGGYRFRYDTRPSRLLHVNEFFTRFPWLFCRGGDQTLFVTRTLFDALGGYDERFVIMEEYDLMRRATARGARLRVMAGEVVVSARKYGPNAWLRVQLANATAVRAFRQGVAPVHIKRRYVQMLRPYL